MDEQINQTKSCSKLRVVPGCSAVQYTQSVIPMNCMSFG